MKTSKIQHFYTPFYIGETFYIGDAKYLCDKQEAFLRLKHLLILLHQLVIHSLQVRGLWAAVVNHQLHLVIASLSNDNKNLLRQIAFRDMVVTPAGRDIATTLLARYLGDSANTNKLRKISPGLYRAEDDAGNKALELFIAAEKVQKCSGERQDS